MNATSCGPTIPWKGLGKEFWWE